MTYHTSVIKTGKQQFVSWLVSKSCTDTENWEKKKNLQYRVGLEISWASHQQPKWGKKQKQKKHNTLNFSTKHAEHRMWMNNLATCRQNCSPRPSDLEVKATRTVWSMPSVLRTTGDPARSWAQNPHYSHSHTGLLTRKHEYTFILSASVNQLVSFTTQAEGALKALRCC